MTKSTKLPSAEIAQVRMPCLSRYFCVVYRMKKKTKKNNKKNALVQSNGTANARRESECTTHSHISKQKSGDQLKRLHEHTCRSPAWLSNIHVDGPNTTVCLKISVVY